MTHLTICRRSQGRRAVASSGYTLTELLTVLAIVLALTWLFVPYFPNNTRNGKGRQSTCASHMKQIGLAFGQYLSDYDGVYPTCDNDRAKLMGRPPAHGTPEAREPSGPPEQDWHVVLQPYVPNGEILRCPNDTSDTSLPDRGGSSGYVASYSVNGWSEADLKASAVKAPESWILLGERNNRTRGPKTWWMFYFWTWQGTPVVWPPASTPIPTDGAAEDLDLTRHSTGSNWLFGDGHVKWQKFENLWKGGDENPFCPYPASRPPAPSP